MRRQSDVALAPYCTMQVGGPARWFVEARSEADVLAALRWAREWTVPVHVLGGGSNVIVDDTGFPGLVIRVAIRDVNAEQIGSRKVYRAGAGEPWDALVAQTVADDCAGLECLSGIPGLVGGTPVQNVGAYGQEVAETILSVHAIDRGSEKPTILTNAQCAFGYRTSRFRRDDASRYVVTRVTFSLTRGGAPTITYADVVSHFARRNANTAPTLADVRAAILQIRRGKGMVIEPSNPARRSCGSFFVNPIVSHDDLDRVRAVSADPAVPHYAVEGDQVKIPAAWLIERAGFRKGFIRGAVGLSPFQAQALMNRGGATAADVLALAADIKRAVWTTFGISIVPEPVFVGFDDSPLLRFLLTHPGGHPPG